MENKLAKILENEEWYQALVEECRAIITESVFTSRWALVEGYWNLGKRILDENDNFKREKIYGKEITTRVSQSLDRSKRTVERAIQFVKKYPDLGKLPEGKNISWHKVVNKYLPETINPRQKAKISVRVCDDCGGYHIVPSEKVCTCRYAKIEKHGP